MIPYTKIMVFGTFDILHKGHINFFRQAIRLSKKPFLIVSVARDINVKKIKGQRPLKSEKNRLKNIEFFFKKKWKTKNFRVTLGSKNNYLSHILKEKPEIIALGYDQTAYTKHLAKILKNHGLVVKIRRLKAFMAKKYKSSLFKAKSVIIN